MISAFPGFTNKRHPRSSSRPPATLRGSPAGRRGRPWGSSRPASTSAGRSRGSGRLVGTFAGLRPATSGSGQRIPVPAGEVRLRPAASGFGRRIPAPAGEFRLWPATSGSDPTGPAKSGSGRRRPRCSSRPAAEEERARAVTSVRSGLVTGPPRQPNVKNVTEYTGQTMRII